MKNCKSLLALLITVAMLVTMLASAFAVSAEETAGVTQVQSTIDFSALTKNTDVTAAVEAIKAAGAVDASNLILDDCYSVLATPPGGYVDGYYVQKLDAGEGRVFLTAPILDLTYWCGADQDAGFYIKIEGSVDGVNYFPFYTEDQGFGENGQPSAKAVKHLALHGAEGYQTAYVKITMNRHAGPTGAAVVKSVVTANTVAAGTQTVQSKVDFSSMTVTDDKTAAAEAMKQNGVVESSNLWISQVYEPHADPGGYLGEGYYVQKLEAGEGKVFDGAPVVELNYWLATNAELQGYIKVEGSLDGETYYPFLELREGQGDAYKRVTEGDLAVTLNGAEGASVVYVRVTMQHWAAPTGAAISTSTITAAVKDAAPSEPEVTEPEATEPETPETPEVPEGYEKQKIDLTGTVVGACSGNSATAGSYAEFTWWSDGRPDWKPLGNFVDGDLSTYFSFGASAGERADLYLDLSKNDNGYTAIDEFTIYHGSQGPVPSIMVVLLLADGTEWTKTYETNWAQFAGNLEQTEIFEETQNAVGMYIWQNGSDSAHFGDIMMYQYVASEEPEATEPEATEPEATEPEATEPEATEPEATEPEATEPEATEPEATEPEATEPEATEPEATEPEATEPEATEPSAPAEDNTASKADKLEDGNKVVIYFNKGDVIIGDTFVEGNKRLDSSDATVEDGKLTFADGALVLTVSVDKDGNITFQTEDGKYLTSGATGNSVALTDEATEFSLWVLEETEGGYLVKNVNAAYNGNAQYLEYYNGFTTYGINASSDLANYTFNFYVLDEPQGEEPTEPETPTEPEKPTDPDGSGKTGDVALSVLVGMLAISAIGGAVVISKKKEF